MKFRFQCLEIKYFFLEIKFYWNTSRFIYLHLWLLSHYNGRLEYLQETIWLEKHNILPIRLTE